MAQQNTSNTGRIKSKRTTVDGINFDSSLEAYGYSTFKKAGLEPQYEKETFIIVEAFEFQGEKVRPMSYTPDFISDKYKLIIELKGWPNDAWPLRQKIFKYFLTKTNSKYKDYTYYLLKNKTDINELVKTLVYNKKSKKDENNKTIT